MRALTKATTRQVQHDLVLLLVQHAIRPAILRLARNPIPTSVFHTNDLLDGRAAVHAKAHQDLDLQDRPRHGAGAIGRVPALRPWAAKSAPVPHDDRPAHRLFALKLQTFLVGERQVAPGLHLDDPVMIPIISLTRLARAVSPTWLRTRVAPALLARTFLHETAALPLLGPAAALARARCGWL